MPLFVLSKSQVLSNQHEKKHIYVLMQSNLAKLEIAVVLYVGLPDSFESEGFDRNHILMQNCQNELAHEVSKRQSKYNCCSSQWIAN